MPDQEKQTNNAKSLRCQFFVTLGIFVALVALSVLVFPLGAYADDPQRSVNLSSILHSLQMITTVVLLPIGIIIAGWRIAYLGIFCAMAGIDPLNMLNSTDGSVSTSTAVAEIKQHLSGFVKGLCWVGGIWIVFQIALTIAQMLAKSVMGLSS